MALSAERSMIASVKGWAETGELKRHRNGFLDVVTTAARSGYGKRQRS
jgi:hypothetical protein